VCPRQAYNACVVTLDLGHLTCVFANGHAINWLFLDSTLHHPLPFAVCLCILGQELTLHAFGMAKRDDAVISTISLHKQSPHTPLTGGRTRNNHHAHLTAARAAH
jgi:hypothetical protein